MCEAGRPVPSGPRETHRTGRQTRRGDVLLFALFILVTLSGLGACQAPEPPLRVATSQWIGYQPLHLAEEHALFPTEQIRLVSFGSNTETLRAFRNGNVEVAALTLDEALQLRDVGHDARVILVMDYSEGADSIIARPDIERLEDLRGRRVGVESTAATAYLLSRALEFGGLTADDIEVVHLHISRQEQAWLNGQVDALATYEPLRTRLLEQGARELFSSRQMPGEIVDVLVTRARVIEDRPQGLAHLIEGWFAAIDYLDDHPRDAADSMARHAGLSRQGLEQALTGIHLPSQAENCRLLAQGGEALQTTARRLYTLMQQRALVFSEHPPLEQLFDDRVLRGLNCHPEPRDQGDGRP
ncbi:MAG: ABC transporter substrate-binding protein [Gammaproteobacteria bacterium]|nr:ABC transporter substrate-binding protein [Gammaproteobacteria bacterium]MDX5503012.1 ABC transporter substrate-binding protein [Halomonas sp.]